MDGANLPPLHALLIGIDGYSESPLHGCVNDIRAVQRFLIEELGVPAAAITTLLASNPAAAHPDPAPELAGTVAVPTHRNMVDALGRLAGREVTPGDRVLIYYSGHGSFQRMSSAQAYFEGLVPIDFEDSGLLFDLELNRLLQAIAEHGGDLSVILDCCHSAGATRDVQQIDPDRRSRNLRLPDVAPAQVEQRLGTLLRQGTGGGTPARYTVLCACHADEKATECRRPPRVGRSHGLMTATLLDILRGVAHARGRQALEMLRFSDVFTTLDARVFGENPAQRPQLLGPAERRIFGGPWRPRDVGYRVLRDESGGYVLGAGTLAGLGQGATLAVYGPEPDLFPALGSVADRSVRLGELTVTTVSPGKASAVPVSPGGAFELPMGARGRLLSPGEHNRLRVAAHESMSASRRERLAALQSEHGFVLLPPGEAGAELIIGQYRNGDLWFGDDLCGPGEPIDRTAPGPLAVMPGTWADDALDFGKGLAAAIRHYAKYVISLRTYRNGGFSLPSKSVSMRLLDVGDVSNRSGLTQHHAQRPEAQRNAKGIYQVSDGAEVAIEVHNELGISLYVNLFLCSMEGHVDELALDTVVQGRSRVLFWYQGIDGQPFPLSLPAGRTWGIDRIVSVVTDHPGLDLSMLRQETSLYESILACIESKNVKPLARKVESVRHVAQLSLVQIGASPAR